MNTKIKVKENSNKTVLSYSLKSFNCEICKTPYPLKFRIENNYFDLIDYIRPQSSNYVVLESLNQLKDNNNYKSLHIIILNDNDKIVLGRAHESDVRISDISVSRAHTCLEFIDKTLYVKDLKSKFGTLKLVQNDIELSQFKKLSLQIGRTYVESIYSKIKDKDNHEKVNNESQIVINNVKTNTVNSNNNSKKKLPFVSTCIMGKF